MKIRQVIEFKPDEFGTIADAVAEYEDGYRDADQAMRWGKKMEELFPGSIALELQQFCEDCGQWEEYRRCADSCNLDVCEQQAIRSCREAGMTLCEDCLDWWRADEKDCSCRTADCAHTTGVSAMGAL